MKTLPNILFINPSPMAKMEQAVLLEEKLLDRVSDFQTPIGIIEMASYPASGNSKHFCIIT